MRKWSYLLEADSKLRVAERRWHESGGVENHLAFLRLDVRAGNLIDLNSLYVDTDAIVKAFELKDFSYRGSSLGGLPTKVEKLIKARLSFISKKAEVTVLVVKLNTWLRGDYFSVACRVTLPPLSERSRVQGWRDHSNSEQAAYNAPATVFSTRFDWVTTSLLVPNPRAPSAAHYEGSSLSLSRNVVSHLKTNRGSIIYSITSSVAKGLIS